MTRITKAKIKGDFKTISDGLSRICKKHLYGYKLTYDYNSKKKTYFLEILPNKYGLIHRYDLKIIINFLINYTLIAGFYIDFDDKVLRVFQI